MIKATLVLSYNKNERTIAELETETLADVMMITRGWLTASTAQVATAFKKDGVLICSYRK